MKTLVLDIETSGLPPKGADYKVDFMQYPYIVSLAYKINDEETKHFIINQEGRKIPPETIAIHGVTDEMAEASPYKLIDVLYRMISEVDVFEYCIGHNIYFDSSIIKANILRMIELNMEMAHDGFYQQIEVILHKDRRIDTMRLGQKLCGGKWPKLTELHMKLFNEEFKDAHSAKSDVDACYRCYVELGRLGFVPGVQGEINGMKLDIIVVEEEV